MRNFKNNRRRYRSNSYDRSIKLNTNDQNLQSNLGNISDFRRKNFQRSNVNSPKLIQKYSDLAREALSSGDKILYENYMQHAEHFIRLSDNNNQNLNSKNGSQQNIDKVNIKNSTSEENNKEEQVKVE
jgi:hypothetical protein|tara:strand:- start:876 stop:1259 length:384 start_codon:yes stop_codon:yes gene_type:complete